MCCAGIAMRSADGSRKSSEPRSIDLRQGGMSTREAIEYCRKVSGSGIQRLIVSMPGDYELKPLERMEKEIIPAVVEF